MQGGRCESNRAAGVLEGGWLFVPAMSECAVCTSGVGVVRLQPAVIDFISGRTLDYSQDNRNAEMADLRRRLYEAERRCKEGAARVTELQVCLGGRVICSSHA